MPSFEFVCLANSRKMSARCVAGLRTDGSGWIRPVSALEHGALTYLQRHVGDGGDPRHFDLLRVSFEKAVPARSQPENWLIDGSAWKLVRRPAPAELSGLLQRRLHRGEQLFGSCADRIAVAVYENKRAPESLLLVKPGQVRWLTALYSGEKRARVHFCDGASVLQFVGDGPADRRPAEDDACRTTHLAGNRNHRGARGAHAVHAEPGRSLPGQLLQACSVGADSSGGLAAHRMRRDPRGPGG